MIGTLGNVARVIGRRKFDTLIKNIDGNVEELLNNESNIRMNEFSEKNNKQPETKQQNTIR